MRVIFMAFSADLCGITKLTIALTYKGPFTRVMFPTSEGLPLNVYFKTLELLILAE